MNRVTILKVPIDPLTRTQAVERIKAMLDAPRSQQVITVNSEMFVESERNPSFKTLLQGSDLNLPDGTGLLWAAAFTNQKIPERVTGVDTVQKLCSMLGPEHPVFLLGAGEGVAKKAAEVLRLRNPHLKIVGTFAGSPKDSDATAIIGRINESKPHLLLVAYGSPHQEQWIAKHLHELPTLRIAMGVGGTFDFLTGVQKRAPKFLQGMGLEWAWRLLHDPRRIGRIFNAVVVFPLLCLGTPCTDRCASGTGHSA